MKTQRTTYIEPSQQTDKQVFLKNYLLMNDAMLVAQSF